MGSILLILTFLRENIDADRLGYPSYAESISYKEMWGLRMASWITTSQQRDSKCIGLHMSELLDSQTVSETLEQPASVVRSCCSTLFTRVS